MSLKGKKLLVLGGTNIAVDLVEIAKAEGVYTIVADYLEDSVAKKIADEAVLISTTDIDRLVEFVNEREIDGVFCGPSEFNLQNVRQVCERAGLPFYATKEQLDKCIDKASFKAMCREHGVPCVPDFHITEEFLPEDLEKIEYPVMVKPSDSSGSRGLTVCYNVEELKEAYHKAAGYSSNGKVIVEKYIKEVRAVALKFIAYNGDIYDYLAEDHYKVDLDTRHIAFSRYPSKRSSMYFERFGIGIHNLLKGIGFINGSFFFQAVIDENDNVYFHEMAPRPGGGMVYKVVEPITGINDMKMLMREALGEAFSTDDEIQRVNPYLNGKVAASLGIPLRPGTVGSIDGLIDITDKYPDISVLQYCKPGDSISEEYAGTQYSKFGRFKFIADNDDELIETVHFINKHLKILDTDGNDMIYARFDTKRLMQG